MEDQVPMSGAELYKTGKKQRGKPFQPGQSGNPSGRPQGSRNKATLIAEQLIDDRLKNWSKRVLAWQRMVIRLQ